MLPRLKQEVTLQVFAEDLDEERLKRLDKLQILRRQGVELGGCVGCLAARTFSCGGCAAAGRTRPPHAWRREQPGTRSGLG